MADRIGAWAVRDAGRFAVLIDTAGHDPATFARHLAQAAEHRKVMPADIVVGAETVLLIAGGRPSLEALAEVLAGLTPEAASEADRTADSAEIEVPVRYDGQDLDSVAAMVGLSTSEVVAAHCDATYRAAFMGFAPGFAYLVGLPEALVIGRRSQPRSTVPAGSVAIADTYSAVYPRSTPGGWHLLGTTDTVLFDPDRRSPALLGAGDRVRFVERSRPSGPSGGGERSVRPVAPTGDAVVLEVVDPGPLTTVQDRGRPGYAPDGVSPSGAFDGPSAALANRLVGNDEDAAVLETTMAGPRLRLAGRSATGRTLAVTGAVVPVTVDGVGTGQNAPFEVHPGQVVEIGSATAGLRSYIAVSGGVAVPSVLGSRSTDLLSGIGPPALAAGDLVALGPDEGRRPGVDVAPVASRGEPPAVARVRLGPRADWLTDQGRRLLLSALWTVDPISNRVGVRLHGPALERSRQGELAPEGLVTGAIQLTPAGELVVFGPDHPVTGGYPVVAVVDTADLAVMAQLRPGDTVMLRRR